MLSKPERRRFLLDVLAGLASAFVVWGIARLLDADLSTVVLGVAVLGVVMSATTTVAWWRARVRARKALGRLAEAEDALTVAQPEKRSLAVRADEAERRVTAAEGRCVSAEERAEAAECNAKEVLMKLREVEAAYGELKRWEQLEAYTGLADYWHQLEDSDQHPRDKLNEIRASLDFMGHGGSKWTKERDQFSSMLGRIGNNRGKARMLLLNPQCKIARKKSEIRFGHPHELPRKVATSLLTIGSLQRTYDNLQVKLYSHMPHFRLTIVDRRMAIVGHYRSYDRDSEGTPLLAWENAADWSFFTSFVAYFDHEWDAADDVDWDTIEKLAAG